MSGRVAHVWNRADFPVGPNDGHDGPGHRFGDSGYCGGCWWEQIGRYQSPRRREEHAPDCPGCTTPATPTEPRS